MTDPSPIVQIKQGQLRGSFKEEDKVAIFKGVPYARPPIGDLRWRAPQPAESWSGVREAVAHGPIALQKEVAVEPFVHALLDGQGWGWLRKATVRTLIKLAPRPTQSEDCLYLNVRTPAVGEGHNLPVMVWIHGGDHQDGAGSDPVYTGNAIPKQGVVYVSVNYRLGLMGFFAHPELLSESEMGVCGNYGMLDQIAALEWVRDNIAQFGGDPTNVTIFGESAGGESVMHLMVSPLARGLFHKAIAQSPACAGQMEHLAAPFLEHKSSLDRGVAFAQMAGATGGGQIAQLRGIPAEELQQVVKDFHESTSFYPTIDGHVLPQSPYTVFKDGNQAQVPLLIGVNSDEGTVLHTLFSSLLPGHFGLGDDPNKLPDYIYDQFGEDVDELLELYPGLEEVDFDAGVEFAGDAVFGASARFYAGHQADKDLPTFLYMFSRVPPSASQTAGAFHAAEITFVHGTSVPIFPLSSKDKELSVKMVKYWTQFAKNADPNSDGLPIWPQFESHNPKWINFNHDIVVEPVSREAKYVYFIRRMELLAEQMREVVPDARVAAD